MLTQLVASAELPLAKVRLRTRSTADTTASGRPREAA